MLPVLVQRKFACRQQADFVDRINAALRIHVEGADLLDFITEQVDPIRHGTTHRKQVNQATANSIFAGGHDLRGVGVTGEGEVIAQTFKVQARFDPDKK